MATSRVVYEILANDRASRKFEHISRSMSSMGSAARAAAKVTATAIISIGTAAAVGAGEAVKMATTFQSQMERIHTQAGATQKDVNSLTKSLLKMAPSAQQGPQELAASLYHLKSVGMDNAKAMRALKQSSDLAAVGGANLEDTTNALAGAWRSGIKGAGSFKNTVATLNAITGAGNMKMQDLTDAMSTGFLPAAKTFGVSLRSIGSALALMTDEGIPAQLAATRLRMTISLLGAPSKTAAKQLASIGLSSTDLANKMRSPAGLVGAVQMLKDHLDASGLSATQSAALLSRAFGGGRSSSAIMTMLNNLDVLQRKQDQINHSIGKYGPAVVAQRKTASAQFHILMSNVDTLGIKLGLKLLPPVVKFVSWLNKTGVPGVEHFGHVVATRMGFSTIKKDITDAENWIKHFFGISTGHAQKHATTQQTLSQQVHANLQAHTRQMLVAQQGATAHIHGNIQRHTRQTLVTTQSASQLVHANIARHTQQHLASATSPAQNLWNRLLDPKGIDWSKLGKTLGQGLGGALVHSVGAIGTGLKKLFGKIDWMSLGRTLGTKALPFAVSFAVSLANSIFDPTMWWNILKKNWKGILVLLASIVTLPFGGEGSWVGVFAKVIEKLPILKWFAPILRGAERFFAGPLRKGIRKGLGKLAGWFMDGFGKELPAVGKFFKDELGYTLIDKVKLAAMQVGEFARGIGRGLLNGIQKGATGLGKLVGRVIATILKRFVGSGKWLFGHGRSLITGLLGGMLAVMATVPKWLWNHIYKPIINAVKGFFGIHSPSTVFASIGRQLIQGLINGIGGMMKSAIQKVKSVASGIKNVFTGAGKWLVGHGKDMMSGLKSGMASGMAGVKGWLHGHVWKPIVSGVKSLFGISSPSKVFAGFGRDMIRGLITGLIRHNPAKSMGKVFGGASKTAGKALGWLVNHGQVAFSKLAGLASSAWSKVSGFVGGLFGGGGRKSGGRYVDLGRQMAAMRGWTGAQFDALNKLWTRESGWDPTARNPSSGAFGIPQALPPGKMGAAAVAGNAAAQIAWGLNYIAGRYGSPMGAWAHEISHGWYDKGGLAVGSGYIPKLTNNPERVLSPRQTEAFDRLVAVLDRGGASGGGSATFKIVDADGRLLGTFRGIAEDTVQASAGSVRRTARAGRK